MSEGTEQPTTAMTEKPRRGGWLLTMLVGIGAFLLGLGVGALSTGGDPETVVEPAGGQPTETAEPEAEEPTPEPTTPEPTYYQPGPEDFELTVKTLEKQCFGSAGCNVTFRVELGYGGPPLDPSATYEVTYELMGGEDQLISTLTVTGDEYTVPDEESIGTESEDAELVAEVTAVSAY
jgi:hypothetical protein